MESLINLDFVIDLETNSENGTVAFNELENEFREIGVNSIAVSIASPYPPGLKSKGDPITIGSIIVTLAAAGVFTALIEALRAWALRKEARLVKLKIQVEERTIDFEFNPSSITDKQLLELANATMIIIEPDRERLKSKK